MADIFDMVRCGGYVKRVYDGIHLVRDDEDPFRGRFMRGRNGDTIAEVSFNGERLRKDYYVRDERPFRGVIVGWKELTLSAELAAVTEGEEGGMLEPVVRRENLEKVRCAVVYYSNCRKHYVPEDMILEKLER